MTTIETIETPAVVIELTKVQRNLDRVQEQADAANIALRPHIKTHKLVSLAQAQIDRGAVGVTCQKLGEAEVMVEGGVNDILLTYNIMGASKLARLRALAERCRLSVTCDCAMVADGYATAMSSSSSGLTVLVECDTGMGRCGVQTPKDATQLAQHITGLPGLKFGGLMTYPAAGRHDAAEAWLQRAVTKLDAAGLRADTVSTGGTPDITNSIRPGVATEYRAGTYIYMDASLIASGTCDIEDCALRVLATVVSTPATGRAVIDAGSKALTSDTLGLTGFGLLPDHPQAVIVSLSEEHAVLDVSACSQPPTLGDRVTIIPNHACPVSNLFDNVWLLDGNGQATAKRVDARGRVT